MILRRDVNRDLTHDEVDSNFIEAESGVQQAMDAVEAIGSGEGGKAYDSLAAALAADIPDNVIFQVEEGEDAGIWRRDSSLPEGAEFLRGFPIGEDRFVELENEVEDVKEGVTVINQDIDDMEARILPPYQEFLGIDRPDLDAALIEVDSDNKIIRIITEPDEPDISTEVGFDRPDLSVVFTDSDGKVIHKEYTGEVGDDLNKIMAVTTPVDRPDLEGSLIVLDKYDKVIFQSGESNSTTPTPEPELGKAMEYVKRFWNPPEQEGFDVQDVTPDPENILVNYDNLIEKWDEIMNNQIINPDISPYISKSEIGKTSVGDIPIYRYDFKPTNPKYKVVLTSGTHANEKMYIHVMTNFFDHFTKEWVNDPVLEWMRRCIHFIVLPARDAYTLGFEERKRGSRVVPESDPIPMSWTKSGTTVTMTFEISDFPVIETLNANTYFTEVPASALEDKVSFGIISSSDEDAVPLNAYRIGEVLSGRSVSFTVPDTLGATSGTGTFQVWADPNRNWSPIGTNYWNNHVGASTIQPFDNGNVYGFIDNKGTKPLSLRENVALKEMLDLELPDLVYDLHSPAADHYFSYRSMPSGDDFNKAISNMKEFSGSYIDTDFSRLTGGGSIQLGAQAYYESTPIKIPYGTIEWGSGLYAATAKQAQDAMRWLIVAVTEVLKTIK